MGNPNKLFPGLSLLETDTIDYFRDSPDGIGYVDGPSGPYMVVNIQDLEVKLGKSAMDSQSSGARIEALIEQTTAAIDQEDIAIDGTLAYVQELDKRIAEMSQKGRDDRS